MGSLSLLQGIFPTEVSNPGLPHCRQILYQLSHMGSPMQRDVLKEKISEERDRDRETEKEMKAGKRDLLTHMTANSRLVQIQGLTE